MAGQPALDGDLIRIRDVISSEAGRNPDGW